MKEVYAGASKLCPWGEQQYLLQKGQLQSSVSKSSLLQALFLQGFSAQSKSESFL